MLVLLKTIIADVKLPSRYKSLPEELMISHTYTQNTQQQADAKHVATTTRHARLVTAGISPMTAYWLHVRWRSLSMIAWQVDSTQRLNGGLYRWAACFRLLRIAKLEMPTMRADRSVTYAIAWISKHSTTPGTCATIRQARGQ